MVNIHCDDTFDECDDVSDLSMNSEIEISILVIDPIIFNFQQGQWDQRWLRVHYFASFLTQFTKPGVL